MKNVTTSIVVLLLSAGLSYANKYETAMISAIDKLNTIRNLEDCLAVISTFERIGEAEQKEWLPFYYASLGYIRASHTTQDASEKDAYLDKAQFMIDKASKLSVVNDEIVTLQGYIYMMKVVVDPMTRGPEYSGLAMQEFGKAIGLNKDNPRALLLLGRMQLGTNQFMGNDISESCDIIMKAKQLFDVQQNHSALMPGWGKEMAKIFAQECDSASR